MGKMKGRKREEEEEEGENEERKSRKGRKTGRARRTPAHPTFPSKHLEESLVFMVLKKGGRYVLLNHGCSAAPRPASHRASTHGVSCPVLAC